MPKALRLVTAITFIVLAGVIGSAVASIEGGVVGAILAAIVLKSLWLEPLVQHKPQVTTPPIPDAPRMEDENMDQPDKTAPTPQVTLSEDQQAALNLLLSDQWKHTAVFITGPAGTGKSTLLRELQRRTAGRSAVIAPTGVAAVNVGGQTIHSFFRFPPRLLRYQHQEDITRFRVGSPRYRILERLEWLIIEEISMVRADILDAIDFSLRVNRRKDIPFGGVRVVMFGDPLQLEPVVKTDEQPYIIDQWGSPFFFDACVWHNCSFECQQLTTLHRQLSDMEYASVLIDLRKGKTEAVARLNQLVKVCSSDGNSVVLTPRRVTADAFNLERLNRLPGAKHPFIGEIKGRFDENALPAERVLQLKVGAQVMMLRNTDEYVNGDLGTVLNLGEDRVSVRLRNGKVVGVSPAVWENIEYDYDPTTRQIQPKVVGTFRQIPVRLAWALTIHKAQGLTLDTVHVEFERGMFAHGQAYVAVTRCRNGPGLTFSRPLTEQDIIWLPRVKQFMQHIEQHGYWRN